MRDPRQTIKSNVVAARVADQRFQYPMAQGGGVFKMALKGVNGCLRRIVEFKHLVVTLAPFVDFVQTVAQSQKHGFATPEVGEQIIFEVRIALNDPNVPENLVEHSRRAPRHALATQFIEDGPVLLTKQTNDNFAVRKGSVVVRNFAQACVHGKSAFLRGINLMKDGIGSYVRVCFIGKVVAP